MALSKPPAPLRWTGLASVVLLLLPYHDAARGDEPTGAYIAAIKPLLFEKCSACHGALRQEASLRLDTRGLMLEGGDSGAVIEPGDASASLIIERVTADEDMQMPPVGEGTRLTAEEVARLAEWINRGALAPEEPIPAGPADHWAFQRITAPPIPPGPAPLPDNSRDPAAIQNPVDAFIDAGRREHHLTPVAEAPPRILLRRLYLDLIGVPPSREELAAFERDPSEAAYGQIVEQLLSSPAYGQRWGRHWMDIWRYSDWYGLGDQLRNSAKHIWQWRDWIIESLNEDKGYDQMVTEMLAADEIAPQDPDALRATGFLARHYYLFNRTTWMDETIEHTAQAFLGLTFQCAKCHSHKYDPISHEDYYRLRAFFEPYQVRLDAVPGETDLDRLGLPRVFDAHPEAPTYLHLRGDEKRPDESQPMVPGVPQILGPALPEITPVTLPLEAYRPELRSYVVEDQLRQANSAIEAAENQLAEAKAHSETAAPAADASAVAASAESATPPNTDHASAVAAAEKGLEAVRLLPPAIEAAHRADLAAAQVPPAENLDELVGAAITAHRRYQLAGAELAVFNAKDDAARQGATAAVEQARAALEKPEGEYLRIVASRKQLEGPDETAASQRQPYPAASSGRRSALARWLVDRENPLTARVAVNHVWLRHFGQPLVEPVTDFGLRTPAPPQQALLDWLAADLQDHQWSMKRLHRWIVTSHAYRLSSTSRDAAPETVSADPQNQYYWRRVPQRMESQVVRDSLLSLAGTLDMSLGGPSLAAAANDSARRRSLYFKHSRDDQHPFLTMFDDADILRCYRRPETVVPQQALALANSQLALEAGRLIAERISRELAAPADDGAFATAAFETVLGVEPSPDQLSLCTEMLRTTRERLGQQAASEADRRAKQNLVHALLNQNDFITIR